MKTKAVKTDQGWYLRDLPGFEDIRSDSVEVEVHLSADEYGARDYKELRGIVVMEKYMEKEARSEHAHERADVFRNLFRQKYGYEDVNGMDDLLRRLKEIPH